jgi:siroheme synthase (precorrin-2 oxidase/ferrochelatase)
MLAMRNERVTVLLEPSAKARLEARAAAHQMSTSEFIRRAIESYDPAASSDELEVLAAELSAALERIDAKLRRFDRVFAHADQREERRRMWQKQIREQLSASGERWPFPVGG